MVGRISVVRPRMDWHPAASEPRSAGDSELGDEAGSCDCGGVSFIWQCMSVSRSCMRVSALADVFDRDPLIYDVFIKQTYVFLYIIRVRHCF